MQTGRDGDAQGRPVPAAVRGRAVLPRRPLARARRDPRVPALAHPRQGRLRDQGRARLPAARRLRPARVREPHPVAARRPDRHRGDLGVRPTSPGTSSASSAPTARWARRGRRLPHRPYAIPRLLISWALGFGEHARIAGPPELVDEARERLDAHRRAAPGEPAHASPSHAGPGPREDSRGRASRRRARAAARGRRIRPERFARLVTLASVLIAAGREGERLEGARGLRPAADLRSRSCARTSRCSTSSTSAAAPT